MLFLSHPCTILQILQKGVLNVSTTIAIDSRGSEQAAPVTARLQSSRQELIECIKRAVRTDGSAAPLPGLSLHRSSVPGEPLHSVYDPVSVAYTHLDVYKRQVRRSPVELRDVFLILARF